MARAQLKWMLQLLRRLNKRKKRIQSSFVETTLQVFFFLKTVFPAPKKSPVSSPLKPLPTVLKTGYFHLNTTLGVAPPPPTLPAQNDILVSQSIKKWLTPTWPYYYTH